MTHVPALSFCSKSNDAQIETALLRLAELIARQVARELVVGDHLAKEIPNAADHPKD